MKSLRSLVTWSFLLIFLGFLGAFLLFHALLLEPFMISQSAAQFRKIDRDLQGKFQGSSDWQRILHSQGLPPGIRVLLADDQGLVTHSSAPEFKPGQSIPLPKDQREAFLKNLNTVKTASEPLFQMIDLEPRGQSVIQTISPVSPQISMLISQNLEPMRQYLRTSGFFFLGLGLVILVLGTGTTLVLAKNLVKPILQLQKVTQGLTAMDFTLRAPVQGRHELAQLARDINSLAQELQKNQAALEKQHQELVHQVRIQKDFIRSASHELKTPLGLVQGFAEALGSKLITNPEDGLEMARIIQEEAGHLYHLIEDLLSLTQLEIQPLEKEPTDLTALILKALARYSLASQSHPLTFRFTPPGPQIIPLNPHKFLQVLDNIISNSFHHTPPGGILEITLKEELDHVVVTLWNSGPPVPLGFEERVFEPFFRTDASRQRSTGGLGLGLTIVRSIITAHGGTCGLENTHPGVLIWLRIPTS